MENVTSQICIYASNILNLLASVSKEHATLCSIMCFFHEHKIDQKLLLAAAGWLSEFFVLYISSQGEKKTL